MTAASGIAPAPWIANDDVYQLRQLGTLHAFKLPTTPPHITQVGARPNCGIRLAADDFVSSSHALLLKQQGDWTVHDLESTNGTWHNGFRVASQAVIRPGDELRFGNSALIAEGHRAIAFRRWLTQRLDCNLGAVPDLALRAILRWTRATDELILESDHDAVPLARELHTRTLGPDKPFILCDPRQPAADATRAAPASRTTAVAAYDAARGGTLCIRLHQPPPDFYKILNLFYEHSAEARLIICRRSFDISTSLTQPIIIPPHSSLPPNSQSRLATSLFALANWLIRKLKVG